MRLSTSTTGILTDLTTDLVVVNNNNKVDIDVPRAEAARKAVRDAFINVRFQNQSSVSLTILKCSCLPGRKIMRNPSLHTHSGREMIYV